MVVTAGRPLFEAARSAAVIRDDVALEQVLKILVALAGIDGDAEQRRPILQMVLDGLYRSAKDGA